MSLTARVTAGNLARPVARRIIRLASQMVAMPAVSACLGTSLGSRKKRLLAVMVPSSRSTRRVRESGGLPGVGCFHGLRQRRVRLLGGLDVGAVVGNALLHNGAQLEVALDGIRDLVLHCLRTAAVAARGGRRRLDRARARPGRRL